MVTGDQKQSRERYEAFRLTGEDGRKFKLKEIENSQKTTTENNEPIRVVNLILWD